ncbi:hypothetical protein Aco04nite_19590 [Winogradskya consettensis]|uniref:Uncharacterized protein n=1 Tax=Winogradskya consettensis TaxID=113560 RepID=A0A919SEE5_9ACTN|nr:hypothetical protein Aco04nite_19590 [Actinoplanes consettensis]
MYGIPAEIHPPRECRSLPTCGQSKIISVGDRVLQTERRDRMRGSIEMLLSSPGNKAPIDRTGFLEVRQALPRLLPTDLPPEPQQTPTQRRQTDTRPLPRQPPIRADRFLGDRFSSHS